MGIFSEEQTLSDDQAITATAASTNYLDLGAQGTPYGAAAALSYGAGEGEPVPFDVQVTEAFNNLTSLTIDLETDSDSAFASPTTVTSITVLAADLVVGYNIPPLYLPAGIDERYVRLNYTVTGAAPTTGQITAGITGGRQTNQ